MHISARWRCRQPQHTSPQTQHVGVHVQGRLNQGLQRLRGALAMKDVHWDDVGTCRAPEPEQVLCQPVGCCHLVCCNAYPRRRCQSLTSCSPKAGPERATATTNPDAFPVLLALSRVRCFCSDMQQRRPDSSMLAGKGRSTFNWQGTSPLAKMG